jgi:hypothetical protein
MPGFKRSQSQKKSQKRSQSQSKNGGRRRKHTIRKLRRMKKSRKVMGGGSLTKTYNKLNLDQGMMLPKEIGELIKAGKNNTDLLEIELLNMAMTKSTKANFDLLYEAIIPKGLRNVNSDSEKVDQMLKVIIKHLSSELIETDDKIDLPTFDQSKAVSPSDIFSTQAELRGDMPKVVMEGLDTRFKKGEVIRGDMSAAFDYKPTL